MWWGRGALVLFVGLSVLAGGGRVGADSQGRVQGRVTANPLAVTLRLTASTARIGETVGATATARNLGTQPLRDVRLELRAGQAGLQLESQGSTATRVLQGGSSFEANSRICAREPGNYLLVARAQSGEGFTTESSAALLQVRPGGRGACPVAGTNAAEPEATPAPTATPSPNPSLRPSPSPTPTPAAGPRPTASPTPKPVTSARNEAGAQLSSLGAPPVVSAPVAATAGSDYIIFAMHGG